MISFRELFFEIKSDGKMKSPVFLSNGYKLLLTRYYAIFLIKTYFLLQYFRSET